MRFVREALVLKNRATFDLKSRWRVSPRSLSAPA